MQLAQRLIAQQQRLTYSIAGLVRQPDLACPIISGGFSQFGGMARYIEAEGISRVLDATHPYATQISQHALAATSECGIPYWRLQHTSWQADEDDHWQSFLDWEHLLPVLKAYRHIFLSHGRIDAEQLAQLAAIRKTGQRFYLRTAIKPSIDLPDWLESRIAIGPFSYQDELSLFQRLGIDLLVSKNSGGEMTYGKIQAARDLQMPVFMLQRPTQPDTSPVFHHVDELLTALSASATT